MPKQYDMSHEMTLSHEIEKRDAEIKALRAHVQALKDGVTHFHRTHGDMSPLLAAYVAASPPRNNGGYR